MSGRLAFSPSEILLLGPGPSPVHPRVLAAQSAPVLGHLDPEFVALMDRVQADLRGVFGTNNPFTLPISATGSAGMEACIVNLTRPGTTCVVGVHGVFGERMVDLCERQGGTVHVVRSDYGKPLDVARMLQTIREQKPGVVAFVHAETSTGVLTPDDEVRAIARATHEADGYLILDCVTSLGGRRMALDEWGIDAAYSGTQKCLGVPPGLSPVSFSDRAMQAARDRPSRCTSWYLDVNLLGGYWGGERKYHHTAPISAVYGLAAGLDLVFEEGLEARFTRHVRAARALIAGIEVLGLSPLVETGYRTPMLTSVNVPDGIDAKAVMQHLRAVHKIEIGGGLGSLAGKIWRIGLMGHGARLTSVLRVLAGLGDALQRQGVSRDVTEALRMAEAVHDAQDPSMTQA
ncbi:MAG: alanine--glyoxylate aminotransferase family protein [Planctomycetes bacterium]|nr:alanine--glyoxylate aminotransferase family protein [Planctomycetota bacterium]MCB9892627.1 alanine--glyoxylate aminotransferase family protein [Planctomycetota bacterium]MCB9917551.1 alanine--glyoxylate aminotransferase family protein [Planctomycetota bacterium]